MQRRRVGAHTMSEIQGLVAEPAQGEDRRDRLEGVEDVRRLAASALYTAFGTHRAQVPDE
ncbi:hypothetical protein IQ63_31325 [Streptomyces acidiscabies]|uniref:Uncharacterized protein n=1 Tax=Streptomyces acidiscabies TaxID=42234 RepID=A0A0L0JVH6_9ACTN|nr:hypothetical protein IQ63_31325 [Streptomyces acidiscabies]